MCSLRSVIDVRKDEVPLVLERTRCRLLVLTLGWFLGAYSVGAQDSREEEIARQQREKAKQLKTYVPSQAPRAAGGVLSVFRKRVQRRRGDPRWRVSLALWGPVDVGHQRALLVQELQIDRGYYLLTRSRRRLHLGLQAGWRDATQVNYYGLGMETTPDDRTNFRFQQAYAGGSLDLRPVRWVVLRGSLTYEDFTTKEGQGSSPSIEQIYTPATAPGLSASPAFVHSEASAGIDWRTSPGYSRVGGYYGLTFHDYADRDATYSFSRLDADLIQHIPILRETWVVSLRGRVQTTLDDDDVVPYFMLPSLGSGSTLRAYPSWRFRDRHNVLVSAEWRWIPNRLGMDMAIFYDAGKVTSRREDLSFNGLQSNWGLGVRFHGPFATPLRIELARGSEGWNLVFAGSAAF